MDARRLELYELLKPKLDEEAARRLVLALGPEPEKVATVEHLAAMEERIDARFDSFEARVDARFAGVEARFDRLENVLTRRMITIMGAWTILVGSTVGWVSVLLR